MPGALLYDLEGRPLEVASLMSEGRAVVLEFGSLSCPFFRANIMAMESLRARHRDRVRSIVVYTREAHPGRGLGALDSMETKLERARELARRFPGREVLVDSFEGELHRAFGGWPNSVVVLHEGDIVVRAEWSDPWALSEVLGDLVRLDAGERWSPIDVDHNVPPSRDPATLLATLSEAGLDAWADYLVHVPLLIAARLGLGLGFPSQAQPWPALSRD